MNQNSKLNGSVVVGSVRTRLMYKSHDAMASNWETVFPDDILPDDHVPVPLEKLRLFLSELSTPKRGRSRSITAAAQAYLSELNGEPAPAPELFPNEEEAPESAPGAPEGVPPTLDKVPEVPKPEPQTSEKGIGELLASFVYRLLRSAVEFLVSAGPLDIVFVVGIALADYSLWFFMRGIGLAWATVYTLITVHALQMAKNPYARETASKGIMAVFVLEAVSFFLDLAMFNLQVWQAGKRGELPFSVWENPTYAFWVSFALASLFCGAVLYSLSITLSLTSERVEAENFEATHGLKW